MSPRASAPICKLDASGRRRRFASPKRQATPRCGRRVSRAAITIQATAAETSASPPRPPTMMPATFASCACHASEQRDSGSTEAVTPRTRRHADAADRAVIRAAAAHPRARRGAASRNRTAAARPCRRPRRPDPMPGAGRLGGGERTQQHARELLAEQRHGNPERASDESQHGELQHEQREHATLRRAQAPQCRCRVEMAAQIARRGERDRHGGENDRDQGDETEKPFRALQRLAHFGAQVAHAFDSLPGLHRIVRPRDVLRRPPAIRCPRRRGGRSHDCPVAAGWSRGGLEVDEQPWTDGEQARSRLRAPAARLRRRRRCLRRSICGRRLRRPGAPRGAYRARLRRARATHASPRPRDAPDPRGRSRRAAGRPRRPLSRRRARAPTPPRRARPCAGSW